MYIKNSICILNFVCVCFKSVKEEKIVIQVYTNLNPSAEVYSTRLEPGGLGKFTPFCIQVMCMPFRPSVFSALCTLFLENSTRRFYSPL